MTTDIKETFIQLVRLGIGTSKEAKIPKDLDWQAVKTLADEQGLSAFILDGIDRLNTNLTNSTSSLPLQMKLEWIGEVLQNYESRYAAYEKAISTLAGFYNSHGYKMMVLKGYACSLNWPIPNHRPCGDIDIWQFGEQEAADTILFKETGITIDSSHHHHTIFQWCSFTVENHFDFINVHHHKSNAMVETVLKEFGCDDSYYVKIRGEKVYIPSPNLHALFLLRHAMNEFAASGINLRQLLDWAFFIKNNYSNVDWNKLGNVIDAYHMRTFFSIINAICVEDLGFNPSLFPFVSIDSSLKNRVLKDIVDKSTRSFMPNNFFKRILWKYNRWRENEWKHTICYKESMWSAFWSGVWGHLLKPSSI